MYFHMTRIQYMFYKEHITYSLIKKRYLLGKKTIYIKPWLLLYIVVSIILTVSAPYKVSPIKLT